MSGGINDLFKNEPMATSEDADALLAKADILGFDNRRSAMIIGLAVLRIGNSTLDIGFAEMERRYRLMGSETYLLARPERLLPQGMVSVMLRRQGRAPYHLWIAVNGLEEAMGMLRDFGTEDFAQNLAFLDQTGLLCVEAH